jgi:hypothetical protein
MVTKEQVQVQGLKEQVQGLATKEQVQGLEKEVQGLKKKVSSLEDENAQLLAMMQDMEKRQEKTATKEQVQDIQKNVSNLTDTAGILVEDKARIVARRQFGDEFSEPLKIKSIHDIIKLISKADTENVPKDEYKAQKRKDAKTEVVDFLRPLLHSAVKSAAKAVFKQSQTDEFEDEVFTDAKKHIEIATQKIVEAESATEDVEDLKHNLGKIIGGVIQLSKT